MTPKWILALIMTYSSMDLTYCYRREELFKNLFTKNQVGPIIRQPTHHKWRMNYADKTSCIYASMHLLFNKSSELVGTHLHICSSHCYSTTNFKDQN